MTLLPALLPAGPGTPMPTAPPTPPFPFTLQVQVAFNDVVWAQTPVWTDITKYVLSVKTQRGRQHELQQVNPSTATIVLTNQPAGTADPGGRFSPWNTGGPYYNSGTGLTPGHPVRVNATVGSATYQVFYGYTQSWVPAYGQSTSTVTLNCYDSLAILNLSLLDSSALYDNAILGDTPTAYWKCQDPVGSRTLADATGNGNTATVSGRPVFGSTAGVLVTGDSSLTCARGEVVATGIGPSTGYWVTFEGWFNVTHNSVLMSWPTNPSGGNLYGVWLAVDAGGIPQLYYGILTPAPATSTSPPWTAGIVGTFTFGATSIADGKWHHLAVIVPCADPYGQWTLYVDGQPCIKESGSSTVLGYFKFAAETATVAGSWSDTNYAGTSRIVQLPGMNGSVDRLAYYNYQLTPTQILNHYELGYTGFTVQDSGSRVTAILDAAGVPAALQNIETGYVTVQGSSSSLQQTTVMSYLQRVVNTERGLLFQDTAGVIQFKNRHHVYTKSGSLNVQATLSYHTGAGQYYMSQGLVPQEDDTDLWNDVPVSLSGGAIQFASDATSITTYGRRTLQGYTSLLFEYENDAYDLATGLLYQYKNPAPRVRSVTLSSLVNKGSTMPTQLGLKLLDLVEIVWKPIDGSSVDFNQASLVEQITHTIVPGQWTTTFAVTPIGTEQFFIVGNSTNGKFGSSILGF